MPILDENRIRFASSFLKGSAAIWLFNRVSTASTSSSWIEFKSAIIQEFVPAHHAESARDKLRKLKQTRTVGSFVSEFQNMILTIPGMHEDEKIDRFLEGLKYNIRVEVLKAQVNTFDECARVALNIYSALWRAKKQSCGSQSDHVPSAMEIGNVLKAQHGKRSKCQRKQRQKDMESEACFVCNKVGCRPYTCRSRTNNVRIEEDAAREDELFNSGESEKG